MAFVDQYALANDAVFQSRVHVALVTAAIDVMAEAPSTIAHGMRANWAQQVLHHPQQWVLAVSLAVAANAAITAGSTDGDLQFTVNSQWNALAGVI